MKTQIISMADDKGNEFRLVNFTEQEIGIFTSKVLDAQFKSYCEPLTIRFNMETILVSSSFCPFYHMSMTVLLPEFRFVMTHHAVSEDMAQLIAKAMSDCFDILMVAQENTEVFTELRKKINGDMAERDEEQTEIENGEPQEKPDRLPDHFDINQLLKEIEDDEDKKK